ncbi:hypothetical protein [Bacillus cereus group sp. BfR-BA-02730]|uniref:hypothetical protein n=1 Tax=Bacillus cereus group sp. BfR-BA-02730 TaxID=3094893 RepID=UPI0029C47754|nr:hypothetical protein [Bacillus cereus group sp. BfR-BA-02730]MDX5808386.1 hypothetical protein [Bacillus cereus group sp. BfR-BA-02730]
MANHEVVVELKVKGLKKENDAYDLVNSMMYCEFCSADGFIQGRLANFTYEKKEKIGICIVDCTINSKEGGVDSALETLINCEFCHKGHEIIWTKLSEKEISYSCIDEISNAFVNKFYEPLQEYPSHRKFSENHVFDEEKSVKWNREEVERQNEQVKQRKMEWNSEKSRLNAKLQNDCVQILKEDYGLNEAQAEKLYGYVYNDKHSCMHDFFIYLEEFAGVTKEILSLG